MSTIEVRPQPIDATRAGLLALARDVDPLVLRWGTQGGVNAQLCQTPQNIDCLDPGLDPGSITAPTRWKLRKAATPAFMDTTARRPYTSPQ